jgi:hypothetical protein
LPTRWKGVLVQRLTSLLGLGAVILLGFLGGRAAADQPHMVAAREHLLRARVELERADADKGGHRVAALRRVGEAIAEVEAGIAYGAGR